MTRLWKNGMTDPVNYDISRTTENLVVSEWSVLLATNSLSEANFVAIKIIGFDALSVDNATTR